MSSVFDSWTGRSPSLQNAPGMRGRDVNESPDHNEKEDGAVPLFGSWRRAYLAVVVVFVVEVSFFYFVSRFFS